jgi:cytosine deaminase
MLATVWALRDAVLADGRNVDILIDGERIAAVAPGAAAAAGTAVVDGGRRLVLPAFVDIHVHLDKALIRAELREHDGTLAGAIGAIQGRKREYTVDDVARRAESVIESAVLHGATRLRSHVDVDSIGGLTPLEGVQEAARRCAGICEVTTVAFPQEGLLRDPGARDLMEAAMRAGAGAVGGMPHWELDDEKRCEHVRFCFELAERHDRPVDMHVDETDDGSVRTLEMVADEALRRGWSGRVTAGHVCALAAADDEYAARVIDKVARAGITIVSNPLTNLVIQGRGDHGLIRRGLTRVAELRAAGVNLCFGQDCVADGFYPFGREDLLEVALISAHAAHLATGDELGFALDAVTRNPARAWGAESEYGIRPGALADLVLVDAPTWPEALRLQAPRLGVWFRGRKVAETAVQRRVLRQ